MLKRQILSCNALNNILMHRGVLWSLFGLNRASVFGMTESFLDVYILLHISERLFYSPFSVLLQWLGNLQDIKQNVDKSPIMFFFIGQFTEINVRS